MIWPFLPIGLALLACLLLDVFVSEPVDCWRCEWREPQYTVIPTHWLPGLLGSAAVTIGRRVLLRRAVTPSASGLAHEYYHVLHTSWARYAWSRLTGGRYHLDEEAGAAAYAAQFHHGFEVDADALAWHLFRNVTQRGGRG